MTAFPWSLLGIEPTGDARAIRSAYAARIKTMDLDADVEGYAQLRSARDTALRMAKSMPPPQAETPAEEPEEPTPEPTSWLHAAPTLTGEWPEETLDVPAPPRDEAPLVDRLAPDFIADDEAATAEPLAPHRPDPFTAPLIDGHDDAPGVGTETLQSPFARLAVMLDPDGPAGTAPLDEAEELQALALLMPVLDGIHWAPIGQQAEMEDWLANLLARAWPRSAPLLEAATTALGWEHEWGRLDARPTMDYLGERLRGYRFQCKVQVPGHRYHKAWTELHRPGPAGLTRFLRVSGGDVRGLLAGVRKNFPELEDHFDPQRVASWEQKFAWPSASIISSGLVMLGLLIHFASQEAPTIADRDILGVTIEYAFGPNHDTGWLRRHQPDLAQTLATTPVLAPDGSVARQATIDHGIALVRARTYLDGRLLDGPDFEATMRIRLALLRAARADSTEACRTMLDRGSPPSATLVSSDVREAEQRFAASLVERGLLKTPEKAAAHSANVPAELVRRVLKETGLDKEQISAAMSKENDPNRCAVTIALLKATLDWKGEGRREILMTL